MTTLNLNAYTGITVTKIVALTGLKNNYKAQPLCIQKERLLRDAKNNNLLHLIK